MRAFQRLVLVAACCLAPAAPAVGQSAAVPAYITAAVASPLRSPRDVARDPGQKPAEVLAFAGVKPGDRVADFWPIPPYSTALLSAVVGPQGRVYAIAPAKLFREVPGEGVKVEGMLAPFANVTLLVQPFDRFRPPEPLDVVWLGKIYHDFPNVPESGRLDRAGVDRAIFRALKPGGVLLVIDHAAVRGSGFLDTAADDDKRKHRIDPDIVKSELLAAGFEFVGESTLLANPADDHTKSSLDPSMRNHTDRFVFKFRRPLTTRR